MIYVLRKVCRNGQKNTLLQNHAGAGAGDARRQIGITPQYLSKIEHGSARPSMDLVFRIADKLQVKVSHLLESC